MVSLLRRASLRRRRIIGQARRSAPTDSEWSATEVAENTEKTAGRAVHAAFLPKQARMIETASGRRVTGHEILRANPAP